MHVMRAVSVLAYALLTAQLMFAAFVFSSQQTGHRVLTVTGGSMEPRYSAGDVVLIDTTPDRPLTSGDIVTFWNRTGVLVTHRVVSVHQVDGEPHLRTQGDANNAPDPDLAPVSAVAGTPGLHVPSAGFAVRFFSHPVGMLITCGPALALMVISQVRFIVGWTRRRISPAAVAAGEPSRR